MRHEITVYDIFLCTGMLKDIHTIESLSQLLNVVKNSALYTEGFCRTLVDLCLSELLGLQPIRPDATDRAAMTG